MEGKILISTTGNGLRRAAIGDNGEWQVISVLEDNDVRCLASDPADPMVVFAGTNGNGIFRSDDGGLSWRQAGMEERYVIF
jgi:hypothetical protein